MMRFINKDFAAQLRWHRESGWHFALDPVQKLHPTLINFERFLQTHRKQFKA
jgi:hypothetical protein